MFEDEFGLSFAEPVSFTWAPKGQTPQLKRITRFRREISTMVGLTISGKIYKRHFEGSIDAEKLLVGLEHFVRHIKGPFILIWDRSRTHRGKAVKAFLEKLGGDAVALVHNPNPKHRSPLALWISFDGMQTWPYQRVLVEHSSDGPGRAMNYPDGFISKDKRWLHFAYDDNRHRAVHYSAKLPPLPAAKAADAPKPAVKVTRELLNSIHVTPKLIFDPMPAYGQKYLPFAMDASMESTSKGRLWTCWAGGQDGPNAYLLASYSDDQGKSWRDPVFVIDPQAHGLAPVCPDY